MKDYPYPMQARNEALCPFTRDTQLSGFLTLPKSLLCWGLSPGALLVYGLLLDRGKLSQRSGWTDKQGWVYVIFPVRELALALGKGCQAVSQDGLLFTGENIQGLLFSRHVGQKVRRGGGRTRGPKKREKAQDALFEQEFRKLLEAFDALIRRGHSIVIIEHNMDVVKCADHVIDLGPEGGDKGGYIVATGTPEEVAACAASYTGQFLREKLQ